MKLGKNEGCAPVNRITKVYKGIGLVCMLFVASLVMSTNPLGVYALLIFCIITFFVYGFYRNYVDTMAWWLILFSVTYALFVLGNGAVGSYAEWIVNLFAPLVFYQFGKKVSIRVDDEKSMLLVLLLTVSLYSIMQYINVLKDIITVGLINISRVLANEGQIDFKAATLVSVNVSYGFVGLITFFTYSKAFKSPLAILFLALSILSILSTIHLVNRSGLVVAAICVLFLVLYRAENKILKMVLWVLILGGIGFLLYQMGLISDDVIAAFENRFTEDEENTASMGGRSNRWLDGLTKMLEYPFGWSTNVFTFNRYAHNFWIDIARVAGIVPFFSILMVTIMSISLLAKAFKIKRNSIVATLIGLYCCFFTSSFVEPIMEGAPIHFFISCFFMGITKIYVERSNVPCSIKK